MNNEQKLKPLELGLQVPCRLDTKMQLEGALWQHHKNHGEVAHERARQRESKVLEGHL